MKHLRNTVSAILVLSFLCMSNLLKAQDASATLATQKPSHLQIFVDVNTDHWLNTADSIKYKIIRARGANVYMRYDIPFKNTKFGFTPAIGLGSFNMGSNASFTWGVDDTTRINILSSDYKVNKLVVNYVEVPLEFFYMSRSKNPLRIALGVKGGYLISSHTKYKKDSSLKVKEYYVGNLMSYRFGPTIRASYGWFGLQGFYSLTPLFEKGLGPDATPFSVGITIAPY